MIHVIALKVQYRGCESKPVSRKDGQSLSIHSIIDQLASFSVPPANVMVRQSICTVSVSKGCKALYPTIGVGWEVNYQALSHPFPRYYGAADTDSTRTYARRPSHPGVLDSTRPRGPGLGELLAGWAPVLLFAVFPLSALGEHETEILGGPDRSFIPLAAETADVICLEERLVKRTKLIV